VVKGTSMIFDISNTELTNYITNFQSTNKVEKDGVPEFIQIIIDRVANLLNLPKDNIFIQAVDMRQGGKINPHYDAAINGYINYKCNISVLSEDYKIFIGDSSTNIEEKDLYCFEASLYKHWTNEFNSRRIFLSIGFIVPYSTMDRDENDPRIRLSKRIEKYFQNP
jgi:aspartyl/asparaginyl beta-hydroxylase (cupin superfamily)